ncbi:hypothetical protein EBU94_08770 [bacterium]|jgi:hypothetical protein|nr:hypothetical protein [bacterium]
MATRTKGNVIVENIKVGDIHYEFDSGGVVGVKCKVLTLPIRDEEGYWTWKSKNLTTGKEIEYEVREGFSHYSSNLYDYQAYNVEKWV